MFCLDYCKINTRHSFTVTRNQQLAMFLLASTTIKYGICSVSYLEMRRYRPATLHCRRVRASQASSAWGFNCCLRARPAARSLARSQLSVPLLPVHPARGYSNQAYKYKHSQLQAKSQVHVGTFQQNSTILRVSPRKM